MVTTEILTAKQSDVPICPWRPQTECPDQRCTHHVMSVTMVMKPRFCSRMTLAVLHRKTEAEDNADTFVISMFCQTMTIALQAPNDSNETKPQFEFGYVMMNSYVPQEVAVNTIPAVCEGIGLRYEDRCSGFAVELTKESDGHPGEKSVVRIFPLTKDRGGMTFSEGPVWVDRNGQQHRLRASVSILNEVSVSPGF